MPLPKRNKDRVYVAVYACGKPDPDTYHWAIIVGPKVEGEATTGHRFHAKQGFESANSTRNTWKYETVDILLIRTSMLLGRIMIGKVLDKEQLCETLAAVPLVQDDPSWTCRIWVKEAVAALEADNKSLGTRITDWETIEQVAKDYVKEKRDKRRYEKEGTWKPGFAPTFDLLNNQEIHT